MWCLQVHLITTVIRRANACQLAPFDEDVPASAGLSATVVCTCKPRRRRTGKSPRTCYKACHLHGAQPEGVQFSGCHGLDLDPLLNFRRPLSMAAARASTSFLSERKWFFCETPTGQRTPWLMVLIEFLATHRFFPGFLAPGMTVRILVSHFRSYFLKP